MEDKELKIMRDIQPVEFHIDPEELLPPLLKANESIGMQVDILSYEIQEGDYGRDYVTMLVFDHASDTESIMTAGSPFFLKQLYQLDELGAIPFSCTIKSLGKNSYCIGKFA